MKKHIEKLKGTQRESFDTLTKLADEAANEIKSGFMFDFRQQPLTAQANFIRIANVVNSRFSRDVLQKVKRINDIATILEPVFWEWRNEDVKAAKKIEKQKLQESINNPNHTQFSWDDFKR